MLLTIVLLFSITGFCRLESTGCLKNHLIKEIENNLAELKSFHSKEEKNTNAGETYIRWGRTKCPDGATLVYDGFAAGNVHNSGGSGSNFLCLPKDPEWKDFHDGLDTYTGRLYGVEYEIVQDKPYSKSNHDKDMPCAVCLSNRSTVLMVPGKITCQREWQKEFSGYLMSQTHASDRSPSQYICVDEKLEGIPGGDAGRNEAVVYPVESICGSLKCPPYVNGRELTCVVCSK